MIQSFGPCKCRVEAVAVAESFCGRDLCRVVVRIVTGAVQVDSTVDAELLIVRTARKKVARTCWRCIDVVERIVQIVAFVSHIGCRDGEVPANLLLNSKVPGINTRSLSLWLEGLNIGCRRWFESAGGRKYGRRRRRRRSGDIEDRGVVAGLRNYLRLCDRVRSREVVERRVEAVHKVTTAQTSANNGLLCYFVGKTDAFGNVVITRAYVG